TGRAFGVTELDASRLINWNYIMAQVWTPVPLLVSHREDTLGKLTLVKRPDKPSGYSLLAKHPLLGHLLATMSMSADEVNVVDVSPDAGYRDVRPRVIGAPLIIAVGQNAYELLTEGTEKIGNVQGTLLWQEDLHTFVLPTYDLGAVLHGK